MNRTQPTFAELNRLPAKAKKLFSEILCAKQPALVRDFNNKPGWDDLYDANLVNVIDSAYGARVEVGPQQ
jgi:hypothetical protein